VRNILKASHASLKKDWYGGEKPVCAPGRTNRTHASCGVSETCRKKSKGDSGNGKNGTKVGYRRYLGRKTG
jgi:hypothetical protein